MSIFYCKYAQKNFFPWAKYKYAHCFCTSLGILQYAKSLQKKLSNAHHFLAQFAQKSFPNFGQNTRITQGKLFPLKMIQRSLRSLKNTSFLGGQIFGQENRGQIRDRP